MEYSGPTLVPLFLLLSAHIVPALADLCLYKLRDHQGVMYNNAPDGKHFKRVLEQFKLDQWKQMDVFRD